MFIYEILFLNYYTLYKKKKKFLKKTKETLSKVSFTRISLMPNQAAYGRTGEDTRVAALLVPEM